MAPTLTSPQPLAVTAAFGFLASAWNDMKASRFKGCIYGAIFAAMGTAIHLVYQNLWQMTMGLTAGFFLLGPFLCCGLYDLSRQLDRGYKVNFSASTLSWTRNWKSIAFFAAILTFFMIVWARVSVVLFALFGSHSYPDLRDMFSKILSLENLEFLSVWAGVGFVFASLVFAISVISVPMMLDRGADTMESIGTSAKALWNNGPAMAAWAACIAGLIGVSLVLFMPLLIITAPLVGHGSWHAYKTLVPAR